MPDALEEFTRETIDQLLKELPVAKRLEGIPAAKRLEGFSADEILRALSPEARKELARRLETDDSPSNSQ
jgi:hypothetical protein